MHSDTIYTKTPKGILEVKNETATLVPEIGRVLLAVDGKSTVAELESHSGIAARELHQTLEKLMADGYIKPIGGSSTQTAQRGADSEEDLDFTSPHALTKRVLDAARAESKAIASASEQRRAALDARLREEAESRARALAEVRVVAEAEAKAKAVAAAEAAAEERAQAEAEVQAATDPAARAQAEARLRAAVTAIARAQAEAKARADAEERARTLAEAKRTAQEAAHAEAEAYLQAADAAQARAAADGKADAGPEVEAQASAPADAPIELPTLLAAHQPVDAPGAAADTPASPPPAVLDPFELQQQAARLREAADAERREREAAEPKFELEPRAQELQDRVQAERRARETAQAKDTEASTRVELGRGPSTKLPDLDIEAGVKRSAAPAPLRAPPAFMLQSSAPARDAEPAATEQPAGEDGASKARAEAERAAQQSLAEAQRAEERAAAAARSRAAERKRELEENARREALFEQMRRRRAFRRKTALALVALVGGLVAFLQFAPLPMFIPGAQQKISARLKEPVTIARLRYPLLPTPRLIAEGVTIGKGRPVLIDTLTVPTLPFRLLEQTAVFDTVEGKGVTIDPDMLDAIPSWAAASVPTGIRLNRLVLSGVQVKPLKFELGAFDAEILFAPNAKVRSATFKNEKVTLGLIPLEGETRLSVSARDWRPPIGPGVVFSYLDFSGTATDSRLVVSDLQGRVAGGAVNATIAATWNGPLNVEGELRTENVRLQDVMPAFTSAFAASGLLQVNGRYALRSDALDALFAAPRIDANFSVVRGELRDIDLVRTIQASSGTAFRGGHTPFEELTGAVQISSGRYSYRRLQLTAGQLVATAAVDIGPASELSGTLSAEVGAKGRVAARAAFGLGGTLKNPILKR